MSIYTLQGLLENKVFHSVGTEIDMNGSAFSTSISENTKIHVDAKLLHGYKAPWLPVKPQPWLR